MPNDPTAFAWGEVLSADDPPDSLGPGVLHHPRVDGVDWFVLTGPDLSDYVEKHIRFEQRQPTESHRALKVLRAWPKSTRALVLEDGRPETRAPQPSDLTGVGTRCEMGSRSPVSSGALAIGPTAVLVLARLASAAPCSYGPRSGPRTGPSGTWPRRGSTWSMAMDWAIVLPSCRRARATASLAGSGAWRSSARSSGRSVM